MRGTVKIKGDLVAPAPDISSTLSSDEDQ